MSLVIDIETAGEDWQKFDSLTQKLLKDRAKRRSNGGSEDELASETEAQLGLMPFTGVIVAIGALDSETDKAVVYYLEHAAKTNQPSLIPQDQPNRSFEEDNVSYHAFSKESELLKRFWDLASKHQEFVTYSGRTFDLPYLMIRSAVNHLKPTKDLLRGRYLYQQSPSAIHIDLYDQLSFYGCFQQLGGLHLACQAFGIATPKDGEIDGSKVTEFYRQNKCDEIARYNARDLKATNELYRLWRQYLVFK